MRIFHIATAADWAQARRTGSYTTSTRGRTLAEEGFIHASRREQVAGVFEGFYRDVREPLVLLGIETDRLTPEWREDTVGTDTFPHIYGPLNTSAVVSAAPLNRRGGTESMLSMMLRDVFLRIVLLILAMLLGALGVGIGRAVGGAWTPFLGGLAGLAVGLGVTVLVLRRRR